jgi:hypothetical protein
MPPMHDEDTSGRPLDLDSSTRPLSQHERPSARHAVGFAADVVPGKSEQPRGESAPAECAPGLLHAPAAL